MIGLLVQSGAKTDLKNAQGKTATEIAELNGSEAAAKAIRLLSKAAEGSSN
jgi:ankyrin repeat protein